MSGAARVTTDRYRTRGWPLCPVRTTASAQPDFTRKPSAARSRSASPPPTVLLPLSAGFLRPMAPPVPVPRPPRALLPDFVYPTPILHSTLRPAEVPCD